MFYFFITVKWRFQKRNSLYILYSCLGVEIETVKIYNGHSTFNGRTCLPKLTANGFLLCSGVGIFNWYRVIYYPSSSPGYQLAWGVHSNFT